jgi:hypothetical protein
MKPLTVPINIHAVIEVITPKISSTKTNSIFYAGKNIAVLDLKRLCGLEYVLTTAGMYSFACRVQGEQVYNEMSNLVKRYTDKRIKKLDQDDLIGNWGWFGINVWKDGQCLDVPTDCYSTYDEAMEAFLKFVKADLQKRLLGVTVK